MSKGISRREFLKFSGASALSLNLHALAAGTFLNYIPNTLKLGRTTRSLRYYKLPEYKSEELGYYNTDSVVQIISEKVGEKVSEESPIWYRTVDGWINSSFVQPVRREFNRPVLSVPSSGMLVETTVPYTQTWSVSNDNRKMAYRYYYGSTHWVTYAFRTSMGEVWYRVLDDRSNKPYIVLAEHMRPVTEKELAPISADVRNKRIDVDLKGQKVTAFENDSPVYSARIASGYFEGDTPLGEFRVERKQPSRHMAARTELSEFDLPGVPWVCFISWTGVSLHGTYWHNNYGTPQSHGCINLSPEAAKWIYCWTEPYVAFDENYKGSDVGTKVLVF